MSLTSCKYTFLLLFSLLGFFANSQKSELGIRVSYARMDLFNGVHYTRAFSRFKQDAAFEWGVNRTYLQRRFFPRITLGSSYAIIEKKAFNFAPIASYGYACLNTNLQSKGFHQWHEIYGGFNLGVGTKWKGGITFSGGWLMEQYFNAYLNRQALIHTLGFNGSVSLVFCW